MKKSDLVSHVSARASLSTAGAAAAVDAVFEAIQNPLARGESVAITGFATFSTRRRPPRTGRNPATGESIDIDASTAPAFKAGKTRRGALALWGVDCGRLSGMLAGCVDLPGLGLAKIGPFVPFVGAGVGAVRTRIDAMRMTFPRTTTVVPGAGRTGLAWMLTAGVVVALAEALKKYLHGRQPGRQPWLPPPRAAPAN